MGNPYKLMVETLKKHGINHLSTGAGFRNHRIGLSIVMVDP